MLNSLNERDAFLAELLPKHISFLKHSLTILERHYKFSILKFFKTISLLFFHCSPKSHYYYAV